VHKSAPEEPRKKKIALNNRDFRNMSPINDNNPIEHIEIKKKRKSDNQIISSFDNTSIDLHIRALKGNNPNQSDITDELNLSNTKDKILTPYKAFNKSRDKPLIMQKNQMMHQYEKAGIKRDPSKSIFKGPKNKQFFRNSPNGSHLIKM
jgi:hypothetical protein